MAATTTGGTTGVTRATVLRGATSLANIVEATGRTDLGQRIGAARKRCEHTHCHVLVVGEFKQGKSSLINALVNAPICPVDDDVATARAIEIGYADEPTAEVVMVALNDELPETRRISFDDIPSYAAHPPTAPDADNVAAVRIRLPRKNLLGNGLLLVDTPGVGGLGSAHSTATVRALPDADAVLFVSDASQELTQTELEFLRTVRSLCPTYAFVVTKTDFYPQWRRIIELNQAHLDRHGFREVPTFPTSSTLRQTAVDEGDADMNAESGYGELVSYLRDDLAATAERASTNRFAAALCDVVSDLENQLRTELAVLDDPEEAARLLRQLEQANERAIRLRSQSARWATTLSDGNGDLISDIDHDLRSRVRDLVKETEDLIDEIDPGKAWDDFEAQMYRKTSAAVVQNFTLLRQSANDLAARVSQHFEADHSEIVSHLEIVEPVIASDDGGNRAALKLERISARSQAVSALRATAGGMTTISILSGVAGVSLVAPFVAVVGVVFGRKLMKDEQTRQLNMRRAQAKQAIRRYSDEVMFASGKESRDALRRIHRQLRDHFVTRADDLSTSTNEALAAAKTAVQSNDQARTRRRAEILSLREQLAKVVSLLATEAG
jgi:hypothetical protein